ncbi:MAG: hypothetical protein ABL871_07460 [Terricaulis sp.]
MAYAIKPRDTYKEQFKAPGFTSNYSKEEAFVTILTAAVHADQQTRRVEEQELLALMGRTRTLHAVNSADRRRLLEDATDAVRDSMRRQHALENACAKLREIDRAGSDNEGIRASVYAHACDIVHSDLEFHVKEDAFLKSLAKRLDIGFAIADRIEADIMQKNLY